MINSKLIRFRVYAKSFDNIIKKEDILATCQSDAIIIFVDKNKKLFDTRYLDISATKMID